MKQRNNSFQRKIDSKVIKKLGVSITLNFQNRSIFEWFDRFWGERKKQGFLVRLQKTKSRFVSPLQHLSKLRNHQTIHLSSETCFIKTAGCKSFTKNNWKTFFLLREEKKTGPMFRNWFPSSISFGIRFRTKSRTGLVDVVFLLWSNFLSPSEFLPFKVFVANCADSSSPSPSVPGEEHSDKDFQPGDINYSSRCHLGANNEPCLHS